MWAQLALNKTTAVRQCVGRRKNSGKGRVLMAADQMKSGLTRARGGEQPNTRVLLPTGRGEDGFGRTRTQPGFADFTESAGRQSRVTCQNPGVLRGGCRKPTDAHEPARPPLHLDQSKAHNVCLVRALCLVCWCCSSNKKTTLHHVRCPVTFRCALQAPRVARCELRAIDDHLRESSRMPACTAAATLAHDSGKKSQVVANISWCACLPMIGSRS